MDGEKCRIVGDVEGKHGEEIKVCTRAYYAPPLDELKSITSIDLKTSIPNILQAYNSIENPSIRETKDKMVFRADSYKDGWQHGSGRGLPYNGGLQYKWEEPTTSYFKKDNVYRYGAVLTVKDWEHWKLGAANTLTVTVDGESIPRENIERIDDFHVLVYSEKHQARERTPIEEVNVTSNMASIVKLGGTVKTPTITFNDGDQDLYIDGSIGFGWLKWEDSDWYTYEKGEFEPGKYCYYTNVHVGNWEEYAFSDNVTVNWDGKPCDRPTGRAPSQIFVSSPVYIVPETVELVTATSSDIDRIPKLGGAMTIPTFTVQTGQPARFREDYPYCAWFKKVDGQWKECGLHVDMDKVFTEGTYRYCVYLFIGGKGHTEDHASYVFTPDSKVIVNGTMWETWSYKVTDNSSWLRVFSPEYTISSTPANVTLGSAKAVSGGIQVTWQKANGAHAYQVYRKDAVNTKWTVIAKNVRDTEWKDITAVKGTKYTYTVRAVADDGVTLGGYDSAGKSAMVTASPTTPANVTLGTATAGKNGIVVTWSYAADARTYRVYRKAPGDTKWVAVANVNGKSWTDKNVTSGVKYSYTVRGVNANGKLSPGYNKTGVSTVAK